MSVIGHLVACFALASFGFVAGLFWSAVCVVSRDQAAGEVDDEDCGV